MFGILSRAKLDDDCGTDVWRDENITTSDQVDG